MAKTVREIMTPNPITLEASSTVVEAAEVMKQHDVGDVLVMRGGELRGIVTDRDIVVRGLAAHKDPAATTVGDICSGELITAGAGDPVDAVIGRMRERALRRLPVTEGNRPVGIISLGDLAVDRDKSSVLADISAAAPSQ
jgi:CBS domain-containing protein